MCFYFITVFKIIILAECTSPHNNLCESVFGFWTSLWAKWEATFLNDNLGLKLKGPWDKKVLNMSNFWWLWALLQVCGEKAGRKSTSCCCCPSVLASSNCFTGYIYSCTNMAQVSSFNTLTHSCRHTRSLLICVMPIFCFAAVMSVSCVGHPFLRAPSGSTVSPSIMTILGEKPPCTRMPAPSLSH